MERLIGITPELKRKGYGKALLDYSLEKASGTDIRISVSNYKRPLMEFLSLSAVYCAIKPSCGRACTHI